MDELEQLIDFAVEAKCAADELDSLLRAARALSLSSVRAGPAQAQVQSAINELQAAARQFDPRIGELVRTSKPTPPKDGLKLVPGGSK